MSVHCFCNKIKTFLNLSVKINIPASVSRKEAVQFELSTSFLMWKRPKPCPEGLCLPVGYKGLPGFFPPILLQKAIGSSKKETLLKMSVSIFENGTGAPVSRLGWWAEPWGWGCQLGSGAGNPLATRRLVFLPFRATGQYHRPLGKSTHPLPPPPASPAILVLCLQFSVTSSKYFPCCWRVLTTPSSKRLRKNPQGVITYLLTSMTNVMAVDITRHSVFPSFYNRFLWAISQTCDRWKE